MLATLSEILRFVRLEQFEKAFSPMLTTPLPMVALERPEQSEKA